MLYCLRRHPFAVEAHFNRCLVLTYALPAERVQGLLPPGLEVDRYRAGADWGFLAIAMVQTRSLRPAGLPPWMGQDFFLSGYRVFARFRTPQGKTLRGLRILRSDTDRRLMEVSGNLLTHYNYRHAEVAYSENTNHLGVAIKTPGQEADLRVVADCSEASVALPTGSPFATLRDARRFAGPLPYTFDYEPQTNSIVLIKATRQEWRPRPVRVEVLENTFLEHAPFCDANCVLASAFTIHDVPYRWERGIRYPIGKAP